MTAWPDFQPAQNAENGQAPWGNAGGVPAVAPDPIPPAKLASPRLKLETVRDVRRELARIYREARRGELKPETATKLGTSIYRWPNSLRDDSLSPGSGSERCGNRGFSGYRTT